MPLPHKKNFLRDVLPKGFIGNSVSVKKIKEESDVIYHKVSEPVINYSSGGNGKWRIWSLVVVAVLGLTVAVFYVFGSAEITITPRIDEVTFDKDFKAQSADNVAENAGSLIYAVSNVEKIGTKSLDADGQKLVNRKASGTIIIYNKFSNTTQRLIKNTRFETPDGLIYHIDQSAVVPGRTTVNGKIVPGSVSATVYADEPGTKYNIGMTNFTVPGFKITDPARYASFYAVSKTPMLDGFSGTASYVSDAKQKLARAEIRSELEKQILADAKASLSKDVFIPKGAYTIEFETQPSSDATVGKVVLKEKAAVAIYTFKTFDFDQFLASKASNESFAKSVASSTVEISNRDGLEFTWLSRPTTDSSQISFGIHGDVRFIWIIDTKKVAAELAGKKSGEMQGTLKQWNSIVNANASFSPFWRSVFPSDSSKIKVIIKLPQN